MELAHALIDAGARTNIIDKFGYSARKRAMRNGKLDFFFK